MEHLIDLYNQSAEKNCNYDIKLQFFLRHWLTQLTEFDVTTDLPFYTNLIKISQLEVMPNKKIYEQNSAEIFSLTLEDAVSTLIKRVKRYVELLLPDLNTKIIRQHEIMPVQNAKEFDQTSLQWLSRQPGRTVREKLAKSQKMMAVKRQASFDTIENRLVKRFLQDLLHILDVKYSLKEYIKMTKDEQDLYEYIQSWFYSDIAKSIGKWENYTPNNVLLQHKYYKKIWSSWNRLAEIDELIIKDKNNLIYNGFQVLYLNLIAQLLNFREIRISNSLIEINYQNFSISPVNKENKCTGWIVKENKNIAMFQIFYDEHDFLFEINEINSNKGIRISLTKAESGYSVRYKTNKDWVNYPGKIESLERIKTEILSCFNVYQVSLDNQNIKIVQEKKIGINLTDYHISYYSNKKNNLSLNNLIQLFYHKVDGWIAIYELGNKTFRLDGNYEIYDFYKTLKCKDYKKQDLIFQNMMGYLKNIFQCDCLNYIVPDEFNDFQLPILRKNVQSNFLKSNAIPKSIATIFTLQNKKFEIKEDDIFVVLDLNYETLTWTKLRAIYDAEIHKFVPELKGLTWERFPTEKTTVQLCKNNSNHAFVENVIENLDVRRLSNSNLSFTNCSDLIHTEDIFNGVDSLFSASDKNKIKDLIVSLRKKNKNLKIIAPKFIRDEFIKDYSDLFIKLELDILLGENYLYECQEKLKKIDRSLVHKLWQDHLPKMSIEILDNGVYKKINLVKDKVITPKRNAEVEILINEKILLAKDKSYFNFPLYLGEHAEDFEATLKSSAFPLLQQEECSLRMSYTYGAEQPYKLLFIRENGASLRVEWKQKEEKENIPIPSYPKKLSWDELLNFKNRENKKQNLIEDYIKVLSEVIGFNSYLNENVIRSRGVVLWKNKKTNDSMMVNFENKEVMCFQRNFFEKMDINLIDSGDEVYAELKKKNDKYFAYDITFSGENPNELQDKYDSFKREKLLRRLNFIKFNRYKLYTIFNNARMLDSESETILRDKLVESFNEIECLLENLNLNNYVSGLKVELYLIMACLHALAPQFYVDKLLKDINEQFAKSANNIGYALGDLSTEWQQNLFDKILDYITKKGQNLSISLEVLGIAFWRYEHLVFKLSDEQAKYILEQLPKLLEQDMKEYKSKLKNHILARTLRHFECLLALLRLRERKSFKGDLSNRQEVIKACIVQVDEMTTMAIDRKLEIKTNIRLDVQNKPEGFAQIPDFLYALRLYLTGDDGANAISISYNDE